MRETEKRKLRKIYTISFAVFTAAVGLLIISQVWGIFRSAPEKAFSRASVGNRLIAISPALALWLVALIGNAVVCALTPKRNLPLKATIDSAVSLQKLQKRFKQGGKGVQGVQKLRSIRLWTTVVGVTAAAFLLGWGVSYLFDKSYTPVRSAHIFTSHGAAADRLVSAAPWLILALVAVFLIFIAREHTRKAETELLKAAFADEMQKKKSAQADGAAHISAVLYEKGVDEEYVTLSEKYDKFIQSKIKTVEVVRLTVRIALFVAAVVFIVLGIHRGGMDFGFEKARSICQQCIGLG